MIGDPWDNLSDTEKLGFVHTWYEREFLVDCAFDFIDDGHEYEFLSFLEDVLENKNMPTMESKYLKVMEDR